MKSFKIIFVGAIIAGLLLVSANGALAAYSGTYLSGSNYVNFGTTSEDVFSYDGNDQFSYTTSGMTWAANNGSNYLYGVGMDFSPYADVFGLPGVGSAFGFIQSTYAWDDSTSTAINGQVTSFINNSVIAVQAFQALGDWAKLAYGGRDLETVLSDYAQGLITDLEGYNLEGATLGYGYFYDNDNKFDVAIGTLDEAGLVALFNGVDNMTTYSKTPIPGAIWLLGSGLAGLVGLRRRMRG